MKIVFFTNAYEPIINGVVTTIRSFAKGLSVKGHEVYIFAPRHKDWQDCDKNIFRFTSVNLSRQIYFPIAIPYYRGLRSLLNHIQPDIIHNHHPFVLGKVGLKQAKRLNIPSLYTFHTQYEQYAHYFPLPDKLVRWIGRRAIRKFVDDVDMVTTPTESVAGLLRDYGVNKDVKVLPNPIDLEPYQNISPKTIRERYGLGNSFVLLSVGRLGKEKNIPLMLASFADLVKESSKDIRLLLVGAGPEESALQGQASELGIADKVIFAGMVNYQELPLYYGAADLFLMTSTTETFGLVIIEAMAAGLPVVAVEASGSKDIIKPGHNGLLTPEDRGSFRTSVEEICLNDSLRQKMSQTAKKTAMRYSIENLTEELLLLYEESRDNLGLKNKT